LFAWLLSYPSPFVFYVWKTTMQAAKRHIERRREIPVPFFTKTFHLFSWLIHKQGCAHLIAAMILLVWFIPAMADEVRVAVAANFIAPMQQIASRFERATGHRTVLSYGSTGKFYAQIRNGAPFDVFLSADNATPARLATEGFAISGTQFTYATGKLVLWSPKPDLVDSKGNILGNSEFRHIALANPKLAPYGVASIKAMQALGVYENLKNKFVLGENLPQVHQFVASGNAELGFIALSQIFQNGKYAEGSFWIVPDRLYPPVRQDVIALMQGKDKPAVAAFLKYLKGTDAKEVIQAYGYGL
jgi:molybdate transport system substrate-binding protein